jgi:DUF177 domain-containing protein
VTLAVDVRDLIEQPGLSRPLRVQEPIEGLVTALARVPEDRAVQGDLLLESVVEGVLVSGELSGTMVVSCARCLEPVDVPFTFDVQELFAAGATPADDEYPLHGGEVDLEPMIRDAIVPAMPFAPLCRPECLGLCERCGGDRNLGECSCPPEEDRRWAVLVDLRLPDESEAGQGTASRNPNN